VNIFAEDSSLERQLTYNQEFLQITAMSNLPKRSKAPVDLIPQ
jgi:hypothetical protein